ncbi:hypothetical protein [Gilvimarinus sp. DA14]|uniref:hypothetical protein n=1 Tax=Gilvimarinus sp. DA14 TaxID=2956798 RepID=UPI0020B8F711|nr:hypothetical protein [Gilvimarinus sp. DA14]UTF60127.1 hypothetical protein NHM04_16890 [Gilvimarinus sp. DA14]
MESMNLTQEEKAVVEQYLHDDLSFRYALMAYWPYLIPSVFMAGYGLLNKEYVALSIAFALLFSMAIWFLYNSGKAGRTLQSALKKYHQASTISNEE